MRFTLKQSYDVEELEGNEHAKLLKKQKYSYLLSVSSSKKMITLKGFTDYLDILKVYS